MTSPSTYPATLGARMASYDNSASARRRRWIAIGLGGVASLFLLFDTAIKLVVIQPVVESFAQLGWPVALAPTVGLLQLAGLVLFLTPRSAFLGAIVLTGYLGGAVATHVRVGSPLFSHTLFPVYVAALLWLSLYLRDARLRALVSLRR
ncbi:MAG TPA: DoxX family protein [Gemmatimonadaceae bacterium]|nr:DoxX family protein [Gemmatimonadaceae bacterium]